jgi:hypothetical protein
VAGAAAAIALVVFLVSRGGGGGEPAGGGPAFTWASAAVPGEHAFGGAGHQEMQSVTAVGSNGATAVGYDEANGRALPAAWMYDSSEWTRVLKVFGNLSTGNGSEGQFHGVAAQGETVVAVGVAGPYKDPLAAEQDALVWTYADGTWHRMCRKECGNSMSGGGRLGQGMWAVLHRTDGGFVAVGWDVSDADKAFDAAVWTSPDGREWSRVNADQESLGGAGNQVMRAVTETRSGLLVAVGVDRRRGAAWTSPNGRVWTRVDVDAFDPLSQSGRTELRGVIEAGTKLVAVGFDGQSSLRGAAWVSDGDPGKWQRVQTRAFVGGGDEQALGGAVTSQGTIVVGYDHPDTENQVAAAWLIHGETVQRIENEAFRGSGNREINAVAVLADRRLLAVGDGPAPEGPTNGQDARVWIATPRR